jgi:predicted ester cyclase
MPAAQNREIVCQFYQAFDDRQMERAISLLAPNFVAHMAGIPNDLNRQEFEQFGMSFYLAFSHGRHQFDEVIVADDRVITCGTFIATHLGEFQGLPPTGKQISLDIMHIDRLEDGKIIEHWGQGDALGLMQQLGIIFLPGPKLVPQIFKGTISKLFNRHL